MIPDKTTALTATQAITAALLARARHGRGQHVQLAMLDATIADLWPEGMINYTRIEDQTDRRVDQVAQDLVFENADALYHRRRHVRRRMARHVHRAGTTRLDRRPAFQAHDRPTSSEQYRQ